MLKLLPYAVALILFVVAPAVAEEPPHPDAKNAIFTATHVVIVSPSAPQRFTIQRSYRGDLPVGSTIDLPDFKLVTWGRMGNPEPEPLTDATRILLFLKKTDTSAGLTVTDSGVAFFFRDLSKIEELDAMASKAVAFHTSWQQARDLADPHERIRALFPYLHTSDWCNILTLKELAKLNPHSGDYLASVLPTVSPQDRMRLLLDIRQLPSPKSHAAAIAAVESARLQFINYLDAHHLKSLDVHAHWNRGLPDAVKDVYGTLYYGLSAIQSFRDQDDMPYFRKLIPFLLANNCEQPLEVCVRAMSDRPGPENIPVLKAIWEDYKSHHYPKEERRIFPIDLADALAAQKDPAVFPLLLDLLDDPKAHDSARGALCQVTQQHFRTDAEWKSWYAAQLQPVQKTVPEPSND